QKFELGIWSAVTCLVIWRAVRNLADATLSANPRVRQSDGLVRWRVGRTRPAASRTDSSCGEPGLHADRDRDRGFHSHAAPHAGGAEHERRAGGQAIAAFAG